MPYIHDTGTRPWSDVINEVGGGIRRSAEGLRQHNAQQEEQNRALHPLTQKYFQKVLSGEMDPVDAARAAHEEIDANNNGIPDRLEGGETTAAPPATIALSGLDNGSDRGTDTTDYSSEPGTPGWDKGAGTPKVVSIGVPEAVANKQGIRGAAAAGPVMPKPFYPPAPAQAQLTNRDLPGLEAMTRDVQARRPVVGLPFEQRMSLKDKEGDVKVRVEDRKTENQKALVGVKATFQEKLQKARLEGRATEVETQLAQRNVEMWLRHIQHLETLKNRLEVATINGDKKVEAAIKGEAAAYYRANVSGAASIANTLPFLANDPEAREMFGELKSRAEGAYEPFKQVSTPTMPKVKGPPTSNAKSFKMKFTGSDGSSFIESVPANEVEAAKKKGGVLTTE